MATIDVTGFLRELTRGMAAETLAALCDRELVAEVLAGRVEPAFETIVRRHGPMVYRVAWRLLYDEQETQDVFQAAFLLLAQKVRTLRKHASLASWLHGVAHRLALKAKARTEARRRHEQHAARAPQCPPGQASWEELSGILDAELARLPDKWRLPLVLCYLEGRTQDEAAGQLGWSKNTLRRRLEDARAALGRRLARHGVGPAALSALLVADCAASAAAMTSLLPAALVSRTVTGAALVSAGQDIAVVASARLTALLEGMRSAVPVTTRILTTLAASLVLLIGGASLAVYRAAAQEPTPPDAATGLGAPAKQGSDRVAKVIPDKLQPRPESPARLAGGQWVMSLPAGFKHSVVLRPLGSAAADDKRYILEKAVRFSGVYELRDDRLVLVEPLGPEDAGFAWKISDQEGLVLVGQPPTEKTGQNYLGATLRRLTDAGGEWGPAVNGVRGLVETRDEQLRFDVGTPISIVCRTKNFGKQTPRVYHGRRQWFQLAVTDGDGKPVAPTQEGFKELIALVDETAIKQLPPGAEVSETYPLDRWFDLSRPGNYRISFRHSIHVDNREQPVRITSNVLMIAIHARAGAPPAPLGFAPPQPVPPRPAVPRVAVPPGPVHGGGKRDAVPPAPKITDQERTAVRTLQRIKAQYRITREPAYQAPVQYCLVLLGSGDPTPIWLASDGFTMYVDRNGNGDLTDRDEAIPYRDGGFAAFFADPFPGQARADAGKVQHTHLHFAVRQRDWKNNKGGYWAIRADVAGRCPMYAFAHKFAKNAKDAPVVHLGGPLRMEFEQVEGGRFAAGQEAELSAHVFCQYPGVEKAYVDVDHRLPKDMHPVAEIVFPPEGPGAEPVPLRVHLTQRC